MSFPMFILIIFCIITEAAREVCFKTAANSSALSQTMRKPVVWLGIAFWAVELVVWMNVLEHVALSIAFPIMSLSYVLILLVGAVIFNEPVNKRHITGALFITAGVALIGMTGV